MIEIYTYPLGMVQANCYVVVKEDSCLVIDPGDALDLQPFLEQNHLHLEAVLLTHAHFDHIKGVDSITETYSVPVYVHQSEVSFLQDPEVSMAITSSSSRFPSRVSRGSIMGRFPYRSIP